jgi:hypothetical protein
MVCNRHKPEEIVAMLRHVDVWHGQGARRSRCEFPSVARSQVHSVSAQSKPAIFFSCLGRFAPPAPLHQAEVRPASVCRLSLPSRQGRGAGTG